MSDKEGSSKRARLPGHQYRSVEELEKDKIRRLLRDELRIKVEAEYSGHVMDSIEVSLYLQDEIIARHNTYLGFPEKKEHGI